MLLNALLLSLIYLVSRTDMINGYMMLTKPIVLGPLVGLVLGDLQAGILIGATLELAFIGVMNIGISVVISQLFGAKDFKEMKTAAYTGFISVAVLGVVLTVVGTVLCEPILRMLGTPENIMEDTALYLAIYIWGLLFLFIYNISSGVFTSLGDSKTPLWFLIASSVGNIVLDAVFVIIFHWGVGGVAWATFLAQGVASACAFWAVLRRLKSIETKEKPALFSGAMLRRISIVAIPSILQQSFVSVGNLCIQGLVNGFGSSAIAGYSAGVKLNTFAITSLTALSNSVSSFTGQNIGAGKMERVRSGFKAGLVMSVAVALVFMGAYVFRGENLLLLFMNSMPCSAAQSSRWRNFIYLLQSMQGLGVPPAS